MDLVFLSKYLQKLVPGTKKLIVHDSFIVLDISSKYLRPCMLFLKNHSSLQGKQLLDIWGVDFPEREDRFQVNYLICSTEFNFRLIVRCFVKEGESLESVEDIFPSAGWLEREVWDMYGVLFYNNKDLRRILTDYGFEGYPLRKDFPLSGYVEVRYDDHLKRVVQEPLEVSQEYRSFNFKSPWEN